MSKMKASLYLFIVFLHLVYCQDVTSTSEGDGGTESIIETTTVEVPSNSVTTENDGGTTANIETTTVEDTSNSDTAENDGGTTANIETTTAEVTTNIVTTEADKETTTIIETTTTEITTTDIPILFLSDGNNILSWSPKSTQSVIIEAAEGHKISVNITDCNIDGANGEHATITTDDNTNGLLFTYGVTTRPAYLYNNNRLYGEFVGSNASNFTAVFTRLGEALTTTTTEVPTTTIILPTPNSNDSSTLLVYLAGRSAGEYLNSDSFDLLDALINSIAIMAVKYCENENFIFNGSITSSNVIINYLLPCSIGWPNSETCVQLNFSVPVHLIEDTDSLWTGYQMTTAHLRIMWSRYAETYLPDGTTEYAPPGEGSFKWGIIILLACTLVFAFIILAIRHWGMKVSNMMRRRKLSDTNTIISASDRNSQISLPPHYLQDTPALFENAYPMYNPDKNPEYSEPSYAKTFEYSDYQDLSVELEHQSDEESEVEESGA
ncbi:uncharacterized protein LOC108914345 [Anoplophora glabripennis]|uniref:uncharacterized protein LOC108914345 n=1 Tax=Anoplophora glabripennis TaxID=217634 RepID=UPI0008743301|nr:uncharacterized protein LOC108914345 [Anoplophora glabripennis]